MKHKNGNKKLSLPTDQRLALLRSLSISLLNFNKIVTTSSRAKEARSFFEKLITIAKTDSVHNRRLVFQKVNDKNFVKKIFDVAQQFKDRDGGYTRIIKCGMRRGDSAPMSQLELSN